MAMEQAGELGCANGAANPDEEFFDWR